MISQIITQNYVSFPGLGIGPFRLDPVAFRLPIFGGLEVRWYGIIICVGMLLAFWYASTRAKYEKIKFDDLLDMTLYCLVFGIIGARAYYVIFFEHSEFIVKGNFGKTLYNIVAIWNGGLAIYGAVIAGLITIIVFAKLRRMRFTTLLDVAAPAVMIGQIIGRWGNFTNSEAYGGTTSLPFRMGLHRSVDGGATFYAEQFVHPTFLYESLWNLIGFALIAIFYKKKKYNGQIFLFYMTWYGLGRMFIEGLRTDSLMIGKLRVSQILAGVFFVVGLALLIYFQIKVGKCQNNISEEIEYLPSSEENVNSLSEAEGNSGNAENENKTVDSDNKQ